MLHKVYWQEVIQVERLIINKRVKSNWIKIIIKHK